MNLETMLHHYLICALWSSTDDQGNPLDDKYSVDDFAPESVQEAREECQDFIMAAGALLDDWTAEQTGHDFWLTRNGHGAGFWDRGKDTGEALTALCKPYGEVYTYVGDDGLVRFG